MKMRDVVSFAATLIVSCVALTLPGPAASHGDEAEKLGNVHFPISCNTEAQQGFDRALAMLHSFWFPQATNAFAEVAKADPGCAMIHWGIAISQRSNPLVGAPAVEMMKRGWEAIEKAKTLSANTQRERDYIAALDLYYQDWDKPDYRTRVLAYEKAMEQAYLRHPEDLEAAVFYALALNEAITVLPADKMYSRQLKAAGILGEVLTKQPDHPGALHYLIHSYDFPALATRGVPTANLYASVAPSAPHALHMPSHIYSMTGMWPESIQSNQAALGVAKSYVHAMDFMVYAYLQMAQDSQAERVMGQNIALQKAGGTAAQRTPTGGVLTVYTAYAAIPARYAIERGAWGEAAALELHPRSPPADAITHFTRSIGFARLGNTALARKEIDALRLLRDELIQSMQDYWSEQLEIQRKAASAWVALAEGDKAEALTLMRSAADMEDASEKHVAMENRLWPMRELLGEFLLELNEPAIALKEFEASLEVARNRLRGFYGAAKAAQMTGDQRKAAMYYEEVLALARNSDSDRHQIREAKAFLATR
jgi:tetratricopeptide (TPR) repeat protein